MKIKSKLIAFLESYNITVKLLNSLSYESKLNISLKRDLSHFNKDEVIKELSKMTLKYSTFKGLTNKKYDYRIKSLSSINRKYDKYIVEMRNYKKVFNDVIGFRIICSSYNEILDLKEKKFKIVDLSNGKKKDDGYRGVHIYYQKNNKCYPIEIQVFTYNDKICNGYLHEMIYKHGYDAKIGKTIKKLFDSGKISKQSSFEETIKYVLHNCKKI